MSWPLGALVTEVTQHVPHLFAPVGSGSKLASSSRGYGLEAVSMQQVSSVLGRHGAAGHIHNSRPGSRHGARWLLLGLLIAVGLGLTSALSWAGGSMLRRVRLARQSVAPLLPVVRSKNKGPS